jgi:hypothetical protein
MPIHIGISQIGYELSVIDNYHVGSLAYKMPICIGITDPRMAQVLYGCNVGRLLVTCRRK